MKHKLFKNLSLSLISLVLFFISAEILTRIFWNDEFVKPHESFILPGVNRSLIHEGILYKTNSLGIRDKELPLEKDSNTVRILALGDSYVWGDGLKEDELITVKIEEQLNREHLKKIEVINAGIGGINTKDEYNQLIRLYPVYNPDLVILFFFTNDVLETDSSNQVPSWDLEGVNYFFRKNSRFYSFLYTQIKKFQSANFGTPSFLLRPDYFNLDNSKTGWLKFKKYLMRIRDYCTQRSIPLVFALIPTLTNLDSNYPYKELNEKVTNYVIDNDILFISFFDLFSSYNPPDLWASIQNKHWNGKAASLAAFRLTMLK